MQNCLFERRDKVLKRTSSRVHLRIYPAVGCLDTTQSAVRYTVIICEVSVAKLWTRIITPLFPESRIAWSQQGLIFLHRTTKFLH
ncbi:hypothetical protein RB195_021371 [Necator americanus]|uniref:Uncharacterized protein n=1 Tax=Necator americanus TaxID=51031 RepID=A0ABR1EBS9_NECAM